jgi:Arc/MetJ-type ribon-helix-helix transcriptional regulator
VADIPFDVQPKLLRLLQEREFERLGSTRTQRVDLRLIAATNRDLAQMMADGLFRSEPSRESPGEYTGSMKLKTSLTLSEDLVKTIGREARKGESRSQTVERLLREVLAARARHAADQRDLALINEHAADLNAEAADILRYQVEL